VATYPSPCANKNFTEQLAVLALHLRTPQASGTYILCGVAVESRETWFVPPTGNLAALSRLRLLLFSVALFIGVSLVLFRSVRFGSRVSSILSHVGPAVDRTRPAWTTTRPVSATMAPGRPRKPPQAPPCFTATPAQLVAEAKALCAGTKEVMDRVVQEVQPDQATFENSLRPIALSENESSLSSRIIAFYQAVSTDKELRDASTEAEKLMDDFAIEAAMREDVYKLVETAFQKGEQLDPESHRLLEKERKNFIRNGLGLPGPKREHFKEIRKRISQLSTDFQKNLNEENGGVWLTKAELEGVPADVVDGLERGTGENAEKVKLTFKYPDLFPALKFALSAEVRQKLFIAEENKVSHPTFDRVLCADSLDSVTITSHFSGRPSFSVTRLHVYWVTLTTPVSRSKIKWRKRQKLC
jgi:metallopeptidase MepB